VKHQFASLLKFLTQSNTALVVFAAFVLIGVYVVFVTPLTAMGLVSLLQLQAVALGVGIGAAQIKFTKATAGEPVLGAYVLLVIVAVIVGGIEVLSAPLTYEGWVNEVSPWVAGLFVAKGLFANNGLGAMVSGRSG